jgi:hypothetical protein
LSQRLLLSKTELLAPAGHGLAAFLTIFPDSSDKTGRQMSMQERGPFTPCFVSR